MSIETLQKGWLRQLVPHKTNFTLKMTPMIDMIFLLLIFFLVSAQYKPQEKFLPFTLPAANTSSVNMVKPEPMNINIAAMPNGCMVNIANSKQVQINNQTIGQDLSSLIEAVNLIMTSQKRFIDDPVEITCDSQIEWDHFAKIYNCLCGSGLTDITFQMTE